MTIYGYMRVSSKDQNEDRQQDALAQYDIPINNVMLYNKC